jgi:hypothetical protein
MPVVPQGARASPREIAELRADVLTSGGGSDQSASLDTFAALELRVIAPNDPTWKRDNPRWVALFKIVRQDLDRDVQPALQAQKNESARLLDEALASHLPAREVGQLLAFYHSAQGRRYTEYERRLSVIQAQGMTQLTAGLLGGGMGPGSLPHDSPSQEVLDARQRMLANSWVSLLVHDVMDNVQPATGGTGPQRDAVMDSMLNVVARTHGPELDDLQRQYGSDLAQFGAFQKSPAVGSLISTFKALGKKEAAGGTPDAFKAALDRSIAAHTASWKTAYEAGRLAAAASPRTPGPAAAQSPSTQAQAAQPPGKVVGEFPELREKHLPGIKAIPASGEIVLEVGETAGRLGTTPISYHADIGIFDLTRHAEYRWDLPSGILDRLAPVGVGQRASWAPGTGRLLFATIDQGLLIARDGTAMTLPVRMPGKLKPFAGMESYALSPDGQYVAYYLYTRDVGNLQSDGFGKLYVDLMYQKVAGSEPVSIMRETRPAAIAWNPDDTAIAYSTYTGELVILDRSGKTLLSIHPGAHHREGDVTDAIPEIRWSPNGRQIAFVMGPNRQLNLIDTDGSHLRVVDFTGAGRDTHDVPIVSFAWSPDGRRFAFRSRYQARRKCNEQAVGYVFETGNFPCLNGTNLFTSNIDGSALKRITPEQDDTYGGPGELFWIQ